MICGTFLAYTTNDTMKHPDDEISGKEKGKDDELFETDSHKLSSLHLADQNHVITDEEMQRIQVGVTPPDKKRNRKK